MLTAVMPLETDLQKIGLTDKEVKVYLATLELGQTTVQNTAKKAGVNRATTYVILNSLIKKGLCSTYQQGKKTYFVASSPESLAGVFELQKKEIEEKQKFLKALLPQLHLIHNRQTGKPVVRFFEGKQGLLNCIDEFLSEYESRDETVKMIYPKDRLDQIFSEDERQKYRDVRLKRKIKSEVIYNYEKGELSNTSDGTRIKVDSKAYPITSDIGIYGDSVRIASLGKKLTAVLIKDPEIAKTLDTLFTLAWRGAQGEQKK